ncbi:MAG: DUF5668 domain-containing protein [Candidatus Pedobacter colombiensis]|uniref:DUF5668 domain-containing protein n=1 Tax=Candidatus Pedobacter colombiensis TaxID=3121371 RepID=A0AAJ5WB54_9SPHI|nr:DUF5668 domain-containing protein [Pedobacter sp.]WEK20758.1 MAG: DUF5668 domain-containing protein [Pedobacter sp.]
MDKWNKSSSSSRICSGLIILVIGLVFLLRNFGLYIPDWIFTWPMLLIVIGLLIGFKRNFNGIGWLIMVLVGGSFIAGDIWGHEVSKYYFAGALIIAGLYLIFKPKSTYYRDRRFDKRWERKFGQRFNPEPLEQEPNATYSNIDKNDILDSVSVFGGSHQHIHSKNFKGGDAIAIFGGCDVNLTQADFEGTIELDVVALFGGVKIIVPPSWEVKSEVVAIFGGLDDKRSVGPVSAEPRKIVKIQGVTIFGGVEIRNF